MLALLAFGILDYSPFQCSLSIAIVIVLAHGVGVVSASRLQHTVLRMLSVVRMQLHIVVVVAVVVVLTVVGDLEVVRMRLLRVMLWRVDIRCTVKRGGCGICSGRECPQGCVSAVRARSVQHRCCIDAVSRKRVASASCTAASCECCCRLAVVDDREQRGSCCLLLLLVLLLLLFCRPRERVGVVVVVRCRGGLCFCRLCTSFVGVVWRAVVGRDVGYGRGWCRVN